MPNTDHRGTRFLRDAPPVLMAWYRAVARESEHHPGGRGHGRRHTEELCDDTDEEQCLCPVLTHRLGPDPGHEKPEGVDRVECPLGARNRECHRYEENPTEDHRDDDGGPHPRRGHPGRIVGLLGRMCRCVETRNRVLREQHPEPKHEEEREAEGSRSVSEARIVDRLREDVRERLMVVGDDDQDPDDDHDSGHVPPRGDHVQPRRQPDVQEVDQSRRREEERVEDVSRGIERRAEPVVHVFGVREPEVEEGLPKERKPVSDRRSDCDLTDEVEPPGRPAPAWATELRRPVVQPTGRRIGGGDFRHGQRDDGRHEADKQPAVGHPHRAAVLEADVVRGQAPRKDRDDRERDREVAEPSHCAEKLLRVAESMENRLVVGMGLRCRLLFSAHAALLLDVRPLYYDAHAERCQATRTLGSPA